MTLDEILQHSALRGVAIGCVAGKHRAEKGDVAHAHLVGRGRGWICLVSRRHLNRTTLTHELAHLVLGSAVHSKAWKKMVRQLGGRVERRYLA